MANDTQVHWLTQDSYDRLTAEKEALIANRPVIAFEINERREEGDLKENAGYHAAREQQGQEEARIRTIDDLLANAQVGETPTETGVALIGSVVRAYYNGNEDTKETFLIGTRGEGSGKDDLEIYSPDSLLGRAILGAKNGETREYKAPTGKTVKVTVVTAEPYHS